MKCGGQIVVDANLEARGQVCHARLQLCVLSDATVGRVASGSMVAQKGHHWRICEVAHNASAVIIVTHVMAGLLYGDHVHAAPPVGDPLC